MECDISGEWEQRGWCCIRFTAPPTKREPSRKGKLSIYQSIFVPTLTMKDG